VRDISHIVTAPLVPSSPLFPGKKLDRYELICPIAEGGMASVWIARLTGGHGFEKFVAIKTILPQFAADSRFQKMFIEESRIASRIEHGNVAQILDVGEEDETTYLVMEYVDGDSLWVLHRSLKRRGESIPLGILLRIMADVCGGLHAAHELRDSSSDLLVVVHRDVSPQNILVSARGMAKLIDFGIAKVIDGAASDHNTGPLKGKVRYMAPEQARGEALDRRADIWAVGAVLYYLLSGKAPCEGENEVQTLVRLRNGPPPEPLPPAVQPAVASVVMRALDIKAEGRFATAADLQRALENAMAEAQVVTTAAGVAAFLAEQTGETLLKRKNAIAQGLKLAADRSSQRAILESAPSLTANVPPAATGSTMRAAAVELTPAPPLPGRGVSIPALVGVLLVLAGVAFFTARAVRKPHEGSVAAAPAPSAPAPAIAAQPSASADPPAAPQPAGSSIRTIDLNELPTVAVPSAKPVAASPAPPRAAPAPPVAVPAPAASSPAPKPAPAGRTKIDDGF
jgi:serine/threonine-protein kinase